MRRVFTLEYWRDDEWFVGRLKEIPGVFSQGQTLEELEENIQDAYEAMHADDAPPGVSSTQLKDMELEDIKRQEFIQELERAGCVLNRHGKRHDIYLNPANQRTAPVPRHRDIKDSLCRLIRKQLGLE